jgi:hypothetical protein
METSRVLGSDPQVDVLIMAEAKEVLAQISFVGTLCACDDLLCMPQSLLPENRRNSRIQNCGESNLFGNAGGYNQEAICP